MLYFEDMWNCLEMVTFLSKEVFVISMSDWKLSSSVVKFKAGLLTLELF